MVGTSTRPVLLERPKLAPVREQIRDVAGRARSGSRVEHVSVKATRGEGMGFVGARRAPRRWRSRRSNAGLSGRTVADDTYASHS